MRGGKRPGAGRKKEQRTIEKEQARKFIIKKVIASLEPIVNKLILKAKRGDLQATKELFDRAFGRPPQAIEMPDGSGEIIIKWQK